MEHFQLTLFSMKFNVIMDIGYSIERSHIINDFLSIFNVKVDYIKQSINIDYKHKNTQEFKEKLNSYIIKYKEELPAIQQTHKYFKQLDNDEWFFILPPIEFNTKEKYKLEKELDILNGYKSDISEEKVLKIFGCILNNYELITFNLKKDRKIKIGENNRDKRLCRFCGKQKPNVKFKKEAHAISEALGNKKLILNEECDDCNKFFDENIERDFIYYHDLARTMFGIKNKDNSLPKMKGKDFEFFKDKHSNNLSIAIVQNVKNDNNNEPPKNIVFKTGQKIRLQNIYKALCKFALSVLDSQYLIYFDNTIKWLKDEKQANELPKIALWKSYKFFTRIPEITLYLRNSDNKDLPYLIGEFRFTYYMYIFIIPFSNQDNKEFLIKNEYEEFLKCFKKITDIGDFQYINFSQNIEIKLNFNINFKQGKD